MTSFGIPRISHISPSGCRSTILDDDHSDGAAELFKRRTARLYRGVVTAAEVVGEGLSLDKYSRHTQLRIPDQLKYGEKFQLQRQTKHLSL